MLKNQANVDFYKMHKFVTEFPYQPIQFNPRKAHMNRKLSHMKPRWKNAQHSSYTYTIVLNG